MPDAKPTQRAVVQYAVLCPRDGEVRDVSTTDAGQALRWALDRDADCGRCHPTDGAHLVVSREVTPWRPV